MRAPVILHSLGRSRSRLSHAAALAIAIVSMVAMPGTGRAGDPFETGYRIFNVGMSDYPGAPWTSESDPTSLVTADFDGDGDLDVAVSTAESTVPGDLVSGFAVIFNDGTGMLGNPVHVDVTGQNCFDIVAADFDEDGFPDVAVSIATTSWTGQSVRLYLNDGTGSFSTFVSATVPDGPIGLAAADFDMDGHLDLAVASYSGTQPNGSVSILPGDGAGGLGTRQTYTVGLRPFKLAAGDLDGDGSPDLAVAHEMQAVSFLYNDGSGVMGAPEFHDALFPLQGGMYYPCVALGDTDQDGDLDAFYANTRSHLPSASTPTVVHFRNDGGSFTRVADIPLLPWAAGPTDLDTGDLNGDGWTDLVGLDYSGRPGDGPRVVLNDGAGGFLPAEAYPAGQATFSVGLADMDGDGDADLLSADSYSMAVVIHVNPGDGVFPMPARYPGGITNILADLGDIDGDGDLDVVTSTEIVGFPGAVFRNDGDGTFADAVLYTHSSTYGRGVARAKLRDLDGDGDLDLLYNDAHTDFQNGYNFHTALNDGDGNFGPIVEWPIGTCGNGDIGAFDVDEDGDLDVINCEELACGLGTANRLFVSLNNGDATFADPYTIQISTGPHALIGGDYNADGHIDLVTTHWMPYGDRDFINVHLGNGDGTFQEEIVYQTGQGPRFIVQEDFNGDGHLDVATCNTGADDYGRETMTVLFGTGLGTFENRTDYYAPYSPDLQGGSGVACGDFDRDGDCDLMLTTVANGLALYVNDGTGAFTFTHRLGLWWDPWSPLYADFDGDGIEDLATVANSESNTLSTALMILPGSEPVTTDAPEWSALGTIASDPSRIAPNPFRGFARFALEVPSPQRVEITVHDPSGRVVSKIHEGELDAGMTHAFSIDGQSLSSGVYFVRARGSSFEESRKVVIAR